MDADTSTPVRISARALVAAVVVGLLALAPPAAAEPDGGHAPIAGPRLWVLHDSIMYAASDDLRAELPGHRISFSGWPGYTVGAAPQLVRQTGT